MQKIIQRLQTKNWDKATEDLHQQGYAVVSNVLNKKECEDLIHSYNADNTYRKTITMERYRFGLGEYKYFRYPLPDLINDIRQTVYPFLAPIANTWMEVLHLNTLFPATHEELKQQCHQHGQTKPFSLLHTKS
jgi:hypothetical protein